MPSLRHRILAITVIAVACAARGAEADSSTTQCAGNYNSAMPCCGNPETGSVAQAYQCPETAKYCHGYLYDNYWGTCSSLPDPPAQQQQCQADYNSPTPCCDQNSTDTVRPEDQCPSETPFCLNYVVGGQYGRCYRDNDIVALNITCGDVPIFASRSLVDSVLVTPAGKTGSWRSKTKWLFSTPSGDGEGTPVAQLACNSKKAKKGGRRALRLKMKSGCTLGTNCKNEVPWATVRQQLRGDILLFKIIRYYMELGR